MVWPIIGRAPPLRGDGRARAEASQFGEVRNSTEVGRHQRDEFTRRNDLGIPPKLWEVTRIAGDEVVRASGLRTLKENVARGIAGDLQRTDRIDKARAVLDELKILQAQALMRVQLGAERHGPIFPEDVP